MATLFNGNLLIFVFTSVMKAEMEKVTWPSPLKGTLSWATSGLCFWSILDYVSSLTKDTVIRNLERRCLLCFHTPLLSFKKPTAIMHLFYNFPLISVTRRDWDFRTLWRGALSPRAFVQWIAFCCYPLSRLLKHTHNGLSWSQRKASPQHQTTHPSFPYRHLILFFRLKGLALACTCSGSKGKT